MATTKNKVMKAYGFYSTPDRSSTANKAMAILIQEVMRSFKGKK